MTTRARTHSTWRAVGGTRALAQALCNPDGAIELLRAADLRGMGGAGFPTFLKWQAAREVGGSGWVVCNGNEDEPGTFKDRFLLTHTPYQVVEGALIAAVATKARHVALYVNPQHHGVLAPITAAVSAFRADPLLERIQQHVGGSIELCVVESSGLYVGGEDTAAVASIEGLFPFPRRKPPYPTSGGVRQLPTIVNNVETLALVPHIVCRGAEWYRGLGRNGAAGNKLYCLSGDVLRPGLYELPMGTTLRDLVFDQGGGILDGKTFKAAFTGGPSNTLLAASDLDAPLDFDSLAARGARLGTGAIVIVSEGTSIVRRVADYIDFFANASCGQCPPCKIGTQQLARLLRRIDEGSGTYDDLAALESLTALLPGSGRCGLVDGASVVVASSLRRFRSDYDAHIRARKLAEV